jgi:YgiT-type zinc finger domain-containing protein
MCKGSVHEGFSTFTADMEGCIVVIKNVPSRVCGQCGESSYSDETARRLEQIIQSIMNSAGKNRDVQSLACTSASMPTASAEIVMVNYSASAA